MSLMSSQSVMGALDKEKYDIVPIGITREGEWVGVDAVAALTGGESTEKATLIAGATQSALMKIDGESQLSTATELDVVIPILHGTYGEDGTVPEHAQNLQPTFRDRQLIVYSVAICWSISRERERLCRRN